MVHPFALQLSLGLPDSRNGPDKSDEDHHRLLKHAGSPQRTMVSPYHAGLPLVQDPGKADYLEMGTQLSRPKMTAHGSSNQLTVFYGGYVNVYENVPADKAQAIMSLAGNGQLWSEVDFTSMVKAPMKRPTPPPPEFSNAKTHQTLECRTHTPNNFPPQMFQVAEYCEPQDLSNMLGPCQPMVPKALPIARKESLARFLKKRKEKVLAEPYSKRPTKGMFMGNNSALLYNSHFGASRRSCGNDRMFFGNASVGFQNMGFQDPNWIAESSKQVSECESRT